MSDMHMDIRADTSQYKPANIREIFACQHDTVINIDAHLTPISTFICFDHLLIYYLMYLMAFSKHNCSAYISTKAGLISVHI